MGSHVLRTPTEVMSKVVRGLTMKLRTRSEGTVRMAFWPRESWGTPDTMAQHRKIVEEQVGDVYRTFIPSSDNFADTDLCKERLVPRI